MATPETIEAKDMAPQRPANQKRGGDLADRALYLVPDLPEASAGSATATETAGSQLGPRALKGSDLHVDQELQALEAATAEKIEEAPPNPAVEHLRARGFVTMAPNFSDQVKDRARANQFVHIKSTHPLGSQDLRVLRTSEKQAAKQTVREVKGLTDLHGFLRRFLSETDMVGPKSRGLRGTSNRELGHLRITAKSMLDNLTFIGEREYGQAARGLADYWKSYLDENPYRQICAMTPASFSSKYPKQRKSDVYLRDRVLGTFTDEELQRYSGRIVADPRDVSADPEDTKLVVLDDWIITGKQMGTNIKNLIRNPDFAKFADNLEINLVVGSPRHIVKGFKFANEQSDENSRSIPVKTYFAAHQAVRGADSEVHISGIYSSANLGFEFPLAKMVSILNSIPAGKAKGALMPLLTNIFRPYRNMNLSVRLAPHRLIRNS